MSSLFLENSKLERIKNELYTDCQMYKGDIGKCEYVDGLSDHFMVKTSESL